MSCTRSQYLSQVQSWYGRKESDGSHREIIDVYNSHTPRARGYKMTYKDAWCACFVSACAIKCNATDIIPLEVSCTKMIALAKKLGIWVEDDNYVPTPADIIMYDWEDSGKGDNKGNPNHVGVVKEVNGKKLTVTEGNYKDAVKDRTLEIGGKYIRGYIVPRFAEESPAEPVPEPVKPAPTLDKPVSQAKAKDAAKSFLKSLAGTYKVTASSLNIRHGAGTHKKKMVSIPRGTKVKCYGYYTTYLGRKWLYIQFVHKGTQYTGFASSRYLVK